MSPWTQTRDFSSKYCSRPAPMILPLGSKCSWMNFPNRLELSLSAVLALPNASRIGFNCGGREGGSACVFVGTWWKEKLWESYTWVEDLNFVLIDYTIIMGLSYKIDVTLFYLCLSDLINGLFFTKDTITTTLLKNTDNSTSSRYWNFFDISHH